MHHNPVPPVILAAALSACTIQPELLNSERIEQKFGNYGLEIIQQQDGVRHSSLYSTTDGVRVCRTYAVVEFVDSAVADFAGTHQAVLSGQSIGSSFQTAGWQLDKQTVYVGNISVPGPQHAIAKLMQLDSATTLGLHAYRLILTKNTRTIHYATIVESHHPAYLTERDLIELFPVEDADDQIVAHVNALLDLVPESD